MERRDFLRTTLSSGALAFGPLASALAVRAVRVAIVIDPADSVASAVPVQWAIGELERTLTAAGHSSARLSRVADAATDAFCIAIAGGTSAIGGAASQRLRSTMGEGPERVSMAPARMSNRDAVVLAGSDARGLVYAVLDFADRVRTGGFTDPTRVLTHTVTERPANPVRSVMRQFTSETYDSPWLFDRDFWPPYLSILASQRFNRLHLGFGLGYDTLQGVTDSYLVFLYPFLVKVPGYEVTVTGVSEADRTRALDTLRYISDETVRRGLEFELGVWMHGYKLINSPRARYVVEGLTDDQHAAYCRDALAEVLKACPSISSVALRIHGESGIAEGSYQFWETVFDGVPKSGRTVEIDLHAKGIDQRMIDNALATGMPVNVSPKYWAEHLGMPYHQAAIRDLEMPVAGQVGAGLMTMSEGQRVFTRYGYADLLREDRTYTVRHRVFAGTQRLLLSGDPAGTAAYGRMFSFCGSTGFDWMEPLTCRGRRGTAGAGTRRSGYADAALESKYDWQKYESVYRLWGRLTYNPDGKAEAAPFDRRAASFETALAHASRILPLVTTAHLPSAACDAYWPEVYWNQPMVAPSLPNPYGDSPQPRTFQNVSPLDPQLFSRMTDFADDLLKGEATGQYSPIEVAAWLDEHAAAIVLPDRFSVSSRLGDDQARKRAFIDLPILRGLGVFFAHKFRAGVLYALHEKTTDRRALDEAIAAYRLARDAWAELSKWGGAYASELAASDKISNRGAWADRLPAIDQDIAAMDARRASTVVSTDPAVAHAVAAVLKPAPKPTATITHNAPSTFRGGADLAIEIDVSAGSGVAIQSVTLCYRHVNQAERYERAPMTMTMIRNGSRFHAVIPAAYTEAPYSLQYYVILRSAPDQAWIYPGFAKDRLNLPYVIVRRA
ncbi:MAG: hypothetical protein ABI672_01985 [Vicinamibacteria bacterium]